MEGHPCVATCLPLKAPKEKTRRKQHQSSSVVSADTNKRVQFSCQKNFSDNQKSSCTSQIFRYQDSMAQTHEQLDSKVWPNLERGQQHPILKESSLKDQESFANKVKSQSNYEKEGQTVIISSCRESKHDFHYMKSETCVPATLQLNRGAGPEVPDYPKKVTFYRRTNRNKTTDREKLLKTTPSKDSRVKVIDASVLSPLKASPVGNHMQTSTREAFKFLKDEFPDLSLHLKYKRNVPNSDPGLKVDNSESLSLDNGKDIDFCKFQKKPGKKQPKSYDPISIDIMEVLQKSSKRNHLLQGICLRRFDVKRCGSYGMNVSNVVFKRGKHRETPVKKRYSKLKLVILEERRRKQTKAKNISLNNSQSFVVENTCLENTCLENTCLENTCLENTCLENTCLENTKCSKEGSNDCEIPTPCCSSDFCRCVISHNSKPTEPVTLLQNAEKITIGQRKDLQAMQTPFLKADEGSKHNQNIDRTTILRQCEEKTQISDHQELNISVVHSRKFREYCHNVKSQDLDDAVLSLLKELHRFQDRTYKRDPIRAQAKRRFVLGIREVRKFLRLRKLKVVIIAPDLESINSPGGLDEAVAQIKEEGKLQQIPIIFATNRQKLGYITMKRVPISIVGIISFDGAEELQQKMLIEWKTAYDLYQQHLENCSRKSFPPAISSSAEDGARNLEHYLVRSALSKLQEDKGVHSSNTSLEEIDIDHVQKILINLVV